MRTAKQEQEQEQEQEAMRLTSTAEPEREPEPGLSPPARLGRWIHPEIRIRPVAPVTNVD